MATIFDDAAEQLKNVARDLITIEVNTIIKDNVTGGRMPSPPNALLDIAFGYIRAFEGMRIDVRDVFAHCEEGWRQVATFRAAGRTPPAPAAGERQRNAEQHEHDLMSAAVADAVVKVRGLDEPEPRYFRLPDEPTTFPKVFEALRWAARRAGKTVGGRLSQEQRVLLRRIEGNSDTLRTLLHRYPGVAAKEITMVAVRSGEDIFPPGQKFAAQDLTTLRKVWDIGTETVLVQTVVQMDGDVMTRVNSRFRVIAGGDDEAREMLELHQKSLSTALGRWDNMVRAARAVVEGIAGNLIK